MPELKISPDVAKTVVSSGTVTKTKSVQKFTPVQDQQDGTVKTDIRLAVPTEPWSSISGQWKTKAYFYKDNILDTSQQYDIVAPTASIQPKNGTNFYVIWRKRWEMLSGSLEIEQEEIEFTTTNVVASLNTVTSQFVNDVSIENIAGDSVNYISDVSENNGALEFTISQFPQYVKSVTHDVSKGSAKTLSETPVNTTTVVNGKK